MLFLGLRRTISLVVALTTTVVGLIGAWSYGQAYSQHRGFEVVLKIARAGTGRLLNIDYYSSALHRRAYYLVYLPPGYTASKHYPVLYLLHGMPGKPQVFVNIANLDVRLDNLLTEGQLRPMIMVFPDGRIGGSTYSDSEWADTSSGAVRELTHDAFAEIAYGTRPTAARPNGFPDPLGNIGLAPATKQHQASPRLPGLTAGMAANDGGIWSAGQYAQARNFGFESETG